MQIAAIARRYASAGWRHRWKALGTAWLVCIAGWFAVQLIPSQYESSARVYADADAILATLLRGIAVDSSPAGQVEVLQRTLLSRPNLEKVVSRTDLEQRVSGAAERDVLLTRLAREIRITPQTRNLFTIDYRDNNARVARDVVQTMVTLFMEAAAATDRAQMDSARGFIAQQIAAYEVQLRQAERRRAEFQARFIDLLPSEALGGRSRLEAARTRLLQVQGELQDARMRRDLTQQQIDAAPTQVAVEATGSGNPRLAQAEGRLRDLLLRLTPEHPEVIAAQSAVSQLRASGGGAARTAATSRAAPANPALEQLRVRLVDVLAQVASLERQDRDARADITRLDAVARGEPEVQAQYLNLDRDYNVLRRNYEELLSRRESIQIAGAARTNSDRVKLEVIDPPTLATRPIAPNRMLLAAGVLAAGLGAGLLMAMLFVRLDRSFYSTQDLRSLGLPVLGGLSAPRAPLRLMPALGFACATGLLLVGFAAVLAGVPGILARIVA